MKSGIFTLLCVILSTFNHICPVYSHQTYDLEPRATYPTKSQIAKVFSALEGPNANYTAFFSQVSPTVNWTIEGTHPLAGTYTNRTILVASFARIANTATPAHPLTLEVVNIVGGGAEEWSVQELQVHGICRSGLIFNNRYAWATRWDTSGKIVQARAYLDSALVSEAIQQNEIVTTFTYSDSRDEIVKFVEQPVAVLDTATGFSTAHE